MDTARDFQARRRRTQNGPGAGTDDGLGKGSRGEGLGGRGGGYSKIKLHLTRDASRRGDRPSREARSSWGTSCFPDRGGAGSVSRRVPSAVRPRYRRRAERVQDGRRHLALDLYMNLSSSAPRRLHRDDVERPRGRHRGGSARVLVPMLATLAARGGCRRRSTAGALPGIGPPNVDGRGHSPPDASWNGTVVGAQALAGKPQRSYIFRVLSVSCNTPDGVGQRTRVEAGAGRGLVESVYSSDVLWILHFKSYDAGP